MGMSSPNRGVTATNANTPAHQGNDGHAPILLQSEQVKGRADVNQQDQVADRGDYGNPGSCDDIGRENRPVADQDEDGKEDYGADTGTGLRAQNRADVIHHDQNG